MAGFFESIRDNRGKTTLLAAWMIDGACAGARALFARGDDGCRVVYRDAAFPADCAAEIQMGIRAPGIAEGAWGRLFLEQISTGRKLVICGAGHVALPVIRIAAMLDFDVTAIDDREAFARRAADAGAHRAVCAPFDEALKGIAGDASTAFVVMTREHAYDVDCLRRILEKPAAYMGMMGSRSRAEIIRQQLLTEGYDPEAVNRVRMPIGLPIGSRTPEEIAVSVMAELIRDMNAADSGEGFPPGMLEALTEIERDTAQAAPGAVLAMIVEKRGEAPRRPGTKLLLRADGQFTGTVGGGTAEAMILKSAGQMLREGRRECRLTRIVLEKGAMYCGGEIAVWMLPL